MLYEVTLYILTKPIWIVWATHLHYNQICAWRKSRFFLSSKISGNRIRMSWLVLRCSPFSSTCKRPDSVHHLWTLCCRGSSWYAWTEDKAFPAYTEPGHWQEYPSVLSSWNQGEEPGVPAAVARSKRSCHRGQYWPVSSNQHRPEISHKLVTVKQVQNFKYLGVSLKGKKKGINSENIISNIGKGRQIMFARSNYVGIKIYICWQKVFRKTYSWISGMLWF